MTSRTFPGSVAPLALMALAVGCGRPAEVDAAKRTAAPRGGYVGAIGQASSAPTAVAIDQKLKTDPQLAGTTLDAKSENGAIVLSGKVKTVAQKDRAENVAIEEQKTKNLQIGVLNNIEVQE